MGSVVVRVVAEQGATLPFKATEHAAGADLCAFLPKGPLTIQSGAYAMIPTGLVIELPVGFEGRCVPVRDLPPVSGLPCSIHRERLIAIIVAK